MKNLPWKKIAIGFVAVAVFVGGIFYFKTSKSSDHSPDFINPAFGEYVASYSAGVLSSGSTIRIMLTKDVVDSTMVGQENSGKLFSFNPSVKGKTTWLDKRTIEFKPEARLMAAQVYEVSFEIGKIMEVPKELNVFTFSFQVIPQNFDLTIENITTYDKTDLKRQKIEGIISTADYAEDALVDQMVSATQDKNSLKVTWVHTSDGKQHNFTVEDVTRKDEASKVLVKATGDPLGIERTEEKEVEIPSLSDFKLMNAKVVQNPNQYVVLQFSDPLKEKQNLNGLIRVEGLASVDFEVHDNEIKVFPPTRQAGTKTIYIEAGIRNILDYKMKTAASRQVVFEQVKPQVKFTGKGTILPSTDGLILPFEAVNLKAVDVSIMKVFENNVLQFLQVNNIQGNYEMHRVGKNILKKKIQLDNTGVTDLGKWNRYTLDLAQMINAEPGAIYQIKLNFKKSYSTYNCGDEDSGEEEMSSLDDEGMDYSGYYEDGYYYEEDYYYYEDYDWDERDNPCNSSYYYGSNRVITKNVLASDLGLIAKQGGDGNTVVFVTDLKTTQPMSGVELTLYNYQQQIIGSAQSGTDGKIVMNTKEQPFVLVAKSGAQRGYLKLQDGESLSLSQFDVSGDVVQKGLKGMLYGERGVWRPGDSLHITFVLEDKNKTLPATHPVVFELQNPQGQITTRLVRSSSVDGFYNFSTATSPDAPTGNWTGRVKVGGTYFTQTVRIETVKPNRLKINLDFGTERFTSSNVTGSLDVKWLHGAPARNLKAEFDVLLSKTSTQFKGYNEYVFEDPSREFYSEAQSVFSGYTDSEGHASVNASLANSYAAPGFLNAIFRGKVFEESGNFSIDNFTIPYSPYESYVGLKVPKGERYSNILYLDTLHRIDIATLDADGKPLSRKVDVRVYKLDQGWWWDYSSGRLANYVNGSYSKIVKTAVVTTQNGKGSWKFDFKSPDWGRYFIQVCDAASGHCSGKIIYVDEPGWYSRYRNQGDNAGAAMLSFTSDKENYNIGEKINLTIPGSSQGRALVSIENGSKVIQTYWVDTQAGDTKFSFDVTADMTPNIFMHVMLLQPHNQTANDRPIRLYGVLPARIEDPNTHLEPVITMPDELEPGMEVTIKVSEKSKRKMTYTLAMVDEGLLDLTHFKTPDLWNKFYAREALGVRTWDLYDQVMGAFGAKVERLLAIGGDMELEAKEDDARANRFKPVVKFFGPFTLDGGTASHKFTMPQYIGSVKTMLVVGNEGAYGKAEKVTPVRKPLMVLATLPRVLGPEETVKLPITLFTQEKSIKNIKVEVKASGPVVVTGSPSRTVEIGSKGDLTIDFDLSVKSETGIAKIEVIASSGSFKASDVIEIEIRNPNQPVSKVQDILLDAGKSWSSDVVPFGISGTNTATLEVSNIPPINLTSRLRYLMQYPYGCIEQTTSSVFPQLFLDQVKVLTENEKAAIQRNVTAGIERLKTFLLRDGGMAYWPGGENADSWGTTYAGHFLLEAEAKGYFVPSDLIRKWKSFQKSKAGEWRREDKYYSSDLMQAYRLYTLALSGSADLGAMNRLREMGNLNTTAAWMLASAYAKAGQPEAAKKIVSNLSVVVGDYRELGYCYGSTLRDKALILETLVALNDRTKAFEILKEISGRLSNNGYWMSTQEVAFALKAVSSFTGVERSNELSFDHTINGKTVSATTVMPIAQVPIKIDGVKKESVKVVNNGKGALFVRVIMEGTPARGQEEDAQSNMSINVRYTDTKGNNIDPSRLEQGTEFIAEVRVTHPGIRSWYENLALAQVFPSGWEINNLRLEGAEEYLKTDPSTYQDIRDDRVYTYFDLYSSKTKTYKVMLTAAYAGTFYLPAVSCEAMYDNSIYARKKGQVVEVVKPVIQ